VQKPFALSFHVPVLAVLAVPRSADFGAMPFVAGGTGSPAAFGAMPFVAGGTGSPAAFGAIPFAMGGRGSRAIFPSGVKVILNLVPEGVVAVKAWPVKKVA
jgi:hypothetical protein